ncbi:MAG TPA: hypothetical protein VFC42_14020 [Methylomirabilota bacterium]|nr:hypothetical protein [Methylomirabilota bacterium]
MLKNATYNLMETASVISKGLHRYDTFQGDAQGCPGCAEIWSHMKRADEEQLQRIVSHLRQHIQEEPAGRRDVAA